METFLILFGLAIIYSFVHFLIIQHQRNWAKRTTYEKVVTVAFYIFFALIIIGTME